VLGAAGQLALQAGVSKPSTLGKLAASNTVAFLARALMTPTVLAGLVRYALSSLLWLIVLARADFSFAFPLISLGFVRTAPYGNLCLHENGSLARMAGIALIVAGVKLVGRS
jgi:uncharacterized membrane protein